MFHRPFVRLQQRCRSNPSLLWKVPIGTAVIGGGTAWLGWSWLMGMSPAHVVEQSYRSLVSIYTVAQISVDYKWTLYNMPDLAGISPEDELFEELKQQREEIIAQVHERSAKRLLWVCLRNGGIFTKAGQHIASMNHVLPDQYTKILSVLQDQVSVD
jgi:hypothetical protein